MPPRLTLLPLSRIGGAMLRPNALRPTTVFRPLAAPRALFSTKSPLEAPTISPAEQAKNAARVNQVRRSAHVAGPRIGAFQMFEKSGFRAVMRPPPKDEAAAKVDQSIFEQIKEKGHLSGQRRLLDAGKSVDPKVIPDEPGQGPHELRPEQLVQYSGRKDSSEGYNPNTNVVGVNEKLFHTIGVATGTGVEAGDPTLARADQAMREGARGLLDEVDLDKVQPHSVEEAFAKEAPGMNKWPIEGEHGVKEHIPPSSLGYRGDLPLDPSDVTQRYLRNLALANDSSPDEPMSFDIERITHPEHIDPLTGEPLVIESFTERPKRPAR